MVLLSSDQYVTNKMAHVRHEVALGGCKSPGHHYGPSLESENIVTGYEVFRAVG